MSTASLVGDLENAGRIVRYRPGGNRKARRCLFLTADALRTYNDDKSAVVLLAGRGAIKNAFDHWTLGRRIWGHQSRGIFTEGRFLKPLHPPPPNIWEIKVTEPVVQVRIFGLFLERDHFLVTSLHTRKFLDEGQNWLDVMNKSAAAWNALLPTVSPLTGHQIGDYVSENYDEFPIRTKGPRKN